MKVHLLIRAALLLLLVTCPCAAEDATLLYSGSVTDQTGRALEGVLVRALTGTNEEPTATSDKDGLFWIEAPPATPIRFEKDGYIPGGFIPDPGQDSLLVRLNRAASLTVEVRDHEGKRVPEAKVVLFEFRKPEKKEDPTREEEPLYRGKTGKDGRAAFTAIEPGRYRVGVLAKGFYEVTHRVISPSGGESRWFTIRLDPVLTVSGRVIDGQGKPVKKAEVAFLKPGKVPNSPYWGWGPVRHVTEEWVPVDKEGGFDLTAGNGMPGNFVILFARAPGYAPAVAKIPKEKGQKAFNAEIVLRVPSVVTGRVVDEAGEAVPVLDLEVRIRMKAPPREPDGESTLVPQSVDLYDLAYGPLEEGERGFITDEDGRFRVEPVPEGKFRIVLRADGHFLKESETISVDAGETRSGVEIEWIRGLTLQGRVEDEKGDPVAGAAIQCSARRRSTLEIESDFEGRFEVPGLLPRTHLRLLVRADGFGPREVKDVLAGQEPVVIRLRRAGSLSGVVYDAATGEPVTLYEIEANPYKKEESRLGWYTEETVKSQDGAFHVHGVAEGAYRVRVEAQGYLPFTLDKVEVGAGRETPVPPVHLDQGEEVWGTVVGDADGLPLPGVRVVYGAGWRGNRVAAESDGEGNWRVSGLKPGACRLTFSHPDFARAVVDVDLAGEESPSPLEVRLRAGGSVEATLLDGEGRPRPNKGVYLHHLTEEITRGMQFGGTYNARTGRDGVAPFERVAPGRYSASPFNYRSEAGAEEIEVREGRTTKVTLKPQGTVLSGRVTYRGEPVQGAKITVAISLGESGHMWSETGMPKASVAGDRYEAGPLSHGSYRISAEAQVSDPGAPEGLLKLSVNETIEVPRGVEKLEQDLVFPAFQFAGRVVRADTGEPMPDVWLKVDKEYRGTRTDEAGRFALQMHAPGTYNISVSIPSHEDEYRDLKGWRLLEPASITIPESGSLTGQVLKVGPGGVVKGSVRDHLGNPVVGARMRFHSASRRGPDSTLPFRGYKGRMGDIEGRFRIDGLAAGPGLLYAGHGDYAPAWIPGVVVGETVVTKDIILRPGGSLEILSPPAVDWSAYQSGIRMTHPAYPLPLVLVQPGAHGEYLEKSGSGSWLLPHLPEGTWTLEATIGGRTIRRIVEVREGRPAVVDLSQGD